MRVRWLAGGRALGGEMRHAGQVEDLPDGDAASLIAQGHAEAVEAPPAASLPDVLVRVSPAEADALERDGLAHEA